MPVIDFKEIPPANVADGHQDNFELFARDCLELIGYRTEVGPDRGPDDGRDLVVSETRTGVGGSSCVRWLVSCKHKAHSGRSVGAEDEQDLSDRVQSHYCDGFMGFYSTLPSSSLNRKLEKMGDCQFKVYDSERIEHVLLSTVNGVQLAKRYFPQSMTRWQATFSFQATIIIEGDIQRLDPTGRARIQLTIAEVLGLHYDDIRIVRLDPGSIKVRFQAPIRALPQFLSPVTQKELSGRLKAHESRDTRVLVDDGFQFAQLGERALFLSLYPVTAQQFARFSRSKLVLPVKSGLVFTESEVASVRSRDAYLFCNWLQSSLDGRIRLPTEYEWEFAARSDRFNDAYNDFVRENSGNIWEWCQDSFQNAQRPVAVKRVLRGGNWLALKDADPVASRLQTGGFRVLLDFTNEEENKQLVGE